MTSSRTFVFGVSNPFSRLSMPPPPWCLGKVANNTSLNASALQSRSGTCMSFSPRPASSNSILSDREVGTRSASVDARQTYLPLWTCFLLFKFFVHLSLVVSRRQQSFIQPCSKEVYYEAFQNPLPQTPSHKLLERRLVSGWGVSISWWDVTLFCCCWTSSPFMQTRCKPPTISKCCAAGARIGGNGRNGMGSV